MGHRENTLYFKPNYSRHRKVTGAPVVADNVDLALLLNGTGGTPPNEDKGVARNALNAKGFDSLEGFVLVEAGTNITLQPLELVQYYEDGVAKQRFVEQGGTIGPLVNGDGFALDVNGGGLWFFRIHAVTGAVTKVQIYLAGGNRAEEGSI